MLTECGLKYLTAETLIKLLSQLQPDDRVTPNSVGNLLIHSEDREYVGFIDFLLEGTIERQGVDP
jgi:hypothetical protein